jgi:hypothetical protein
LQATVLAQVYSALLAPKLSVDDNRLNNACHAEHCDKYVDNWIPSRDVRSPEIRVEGFRQEKHSHCIGDN